MYSKKTVINAQRNDAPWATKDVSKKHLLLQMVELSGKNIK